MVKRTIEEPFRPISADLVQAVVSSSSQGTSAQAVPPSPETLIETVTPSKALRASIERARDTPRRTPSSRSASITPLPFAERLEREKRVLLTPSEERAVERVVTNIGAEIGSSLKLSNVLRTSIRLLINSEAELVDRAKERGRIIRPPNGDHAAIEEFEKELAAIIHAGLRDARSLK